MNLTIFLLACALLLALLGLYLQYHEIEQIKQRARDARAAAETNYNHAIKEHFTLLKAHEDLRKTNRELRAKIQDAYQDGYGAALAKALKTPHHNDPTPTPAAASIPAFQPSISTPAPAPSVPVSEGPCPSVKKLSTAITALAAQQ